MTMAASIAEGRQAETAATREIAASLRILTGTSVTESRHHTHFDCLIKSLDGMCKARSLDFFRNPLFGTVLLVSEVTQILDRIGQGDPKAAGELLPLGQAPLLHWPFHRRGCPCAG